MKTWIWITIIVGVALLAIWAGYAIKASQEDCGCTGTKETVKAPGGTNGTGINNATSSDTNAGNPPGKPNMSVMS